MVSVTLNRTTHEIARVRRALGNRFAGVFDRMPSRGDRWGPLHGIPMTVKDHALWDEAESQVRN